MATLDDIVAAAAKVFRTKGYHAATVRDIAEEVGILKGSLYHHFASKEELLYLVVKEPIAQMYRTISEIAGAAKVTKAAFCTGPNKINYMTQTTNLGVRSSNLFGCANDFNDLRQALFDRLGCDRGLRTPCGPGRAPRNRDHRRCSDAPKPEATVRHLSDRV